MEIFFSVLLVLLATVALLVAAAFATVCLGGVVLHALRGRQVVLGPPVAA